MSWANEKARLAVFAATAALASGPVGAQTGEGNPYADKIHAMDFAGVRVGEPLQQVFDVLQRQGYAQSASAGPHASAYGRYRYSSDCDKSRVDVSSDNSAKVEIEIPVCFVEPLKTHMDWVGMEFSRKDKAGFAYHMTIAFTPYAPGDNPLKASFVSEINASISSDAPGDSRYYDSLADQKYGEVRFAQMPSEQFRMYKYSSGGACLDCLGVGYRITPSVNGLEVRIKDSQFYDALYEALVDKALTAKEHRGTGPRPTF